MKFIRYLLKSLAYLRAIHLQNNLIIMNQQELAAALTAVSQQVAKIGTETTATLQKVSDLETALNNAGQVAPEVQTALDALKAQVQTVDDMVADVPTTTQG